MKRDIGRDTGAQADGAAPAPWYREPWTWLVFGVPAAAVLGGAVMLWVSVATFDGPVVDDYYKQGLAIDRTLARDEQALTLGLGATLTLLETEEGAVQLAVELDGNPAFAAPDEIELNLLHATRAGLDRRVRVRRVGDVSYSARVPAIEPGPWHAQIAAQDWRLTSRLRTPVQLPVPFGAHVSRE